mmetsp:Transcript_59168/g.162324  ORF Transcript_59168/g.162324 Transcript_59168/m.162324 type:complete len:142 (+) Transcript_59168:1882-2307(+)
MLPSIQTPQARASVLWCVGEYAAHLQTVAPDVLREMLLSFGDETPAVKLQVLTLAAKCAAHRLEKADLMLRYALDLGKYDLDYDVRSRTRFLMAVCMNQLDALPANGDTGSEKVLSAAEASALAEQMKQLLCAPKPSVSDR